MRARVSTSTTVLEALDQGQNTESSTRTDTKPLRRTSVSPDRVTRSNRGRKLTSRQPHSVTSRFSPARPRKALQLANGQPLRRITSETPSQARSRRSRAQGKVAASEANETIFGLRHEKEGTLSRQEQCEVCMRWQKAQRAVKVLEEVLGDEGIADASEEKKKLAMQKMGAGRCGSTETYSG